MTTQTTIKTIVAVQNRKEGQKGFWTDIGSAVVNPSGTVDLSFDAFPVAADITIQVRESRRQDAPRSEQASPPPRMQIVAVLQPKNGETESKTINLLGDVKTQLSPDWRPRLSQKVWCYFAAG